MKSSIQKFSLVVISFFIIGCNDTNDKSFQQQAMLSVLYAQTATEHKITNIQTFLQASNNLEKALKDKNWTAALEQGDPYQEKPPAIILDVDETVLDNSIFQARSILNGTSYPTGWIDWGMEENAPPVTGVKDFLQKAKKSGIKKFIIIGSGFEYGLSGNHFRSIPINAPLIPKMTYSVSKAVGFLVFSQWALENKLKIKYLRLLL